MLVIKIEVWPHGSEYNKKLLGTCKIVNNGNGTKEFGQYDCEFESFQNELRTHLHRSQVKNHERYEESVWVLLMKAIAAAF